MPKIEIDEAVIRKLAGLLDETGLTEVEYESGSQRIRVSRSAPFHHGAATPAVSVNATPPGAPPAVEQPPVNALLSPMVGTCYLAAEPGSQPFISVGARVTKGQTLLIIEAMKVMNPIPAPQAGTVSQILVSDSMPVEYGQPLLVIE
jgi:acetyl-CoA carboxylase biotin carboxyl carrier protein